MTALALIGATILVCYFLDSLRRSVDGLTEAVRKANS